MECQHLLNWTTETPTEPGWYWVGMRSDEGFYAMIAEVWEENGLLVAQIKGGKILGVGCHFFELWAGPIPHPEGEPITGLSALDTIH